MQFHKLNARGFTHYVALITVVTVALIGGVFVTVLKAHHSSSSKSNLGTSGNSAQSKSKLSSSQKSQSELSSANSTSSPNATSTTPSSKPTTTTPKTSTPSSTKSPATTSVQPTPSPTPAPSQTLLSVLTALITDLDNGAQVNVTTNAVTVPGPISNAQARPIVFTANGQVYFAYRQGSAANFTTSASQTANTMAIVNATVSSPSLVQAHLDKAANIVDPNISGYLVGYSQGGN